MTIPFICQLSMNLIAMDETDVKILGKLLSDARLSYRRIADEIGVSPPTGTR